MQNARGELISEQQEQAIYQAIFEGRKIEAIKLHRQATGEGLKESKDFIEVLERQLRLESPAKFTAPERKKGCGTTVLALGLALAAVVMAALT